VNYSDVELLFQFMYSVSFNSDISAWDVSSVTEAAFAFYGASSFKTDLSSWNVSNMRNVTKMVRSQNLV
jgi:surface protein